jgi:hypothetical protein
VAKGAPTVVAAPDGAQHVAATGDDALADAIEQELFEAGKLNEERLLELLERRLEAEGPQPLLNFGERMYTERRPVAVLRLILRAAAAGGDEEVIETWTARLDDVERALDEIDAFDEAEREARNAQMRGY